LKQELLVPDALKFSVMSRCRHSDCVGAERFFLISVANIGPKWPHQAQTVS